MPRQSHRQSQVLRSHQLLRIPRLRIPPLLGEGMPWVRHGPAAEVFRALARTHALQAVYAYQEVCSRPGTPRSPGGRGSPLRVQWKARWAVGCPLSCPFLVASARRVQPHPSLLPQSVYFYESQPPSSESLIRRCHTVTLDRHVYPKLSFDSPSSMFLPDTPRGPNQTNDPLGGGCRPSLPWVHKSPPSTSPCADIGRRACPPPWDKFRGGPAPPRGDPRAFCGGGGAARAPHPHVGIHPLPSGRPPAPHPPPVPPELRPGGLWAGGQGPGQLGTRPPHSHTHRKALCQPGTRGPMVGRPGFPSAGSLPPRGSGRSCRSSVRCGPPWGWAPPRPRAQS